MASLTKRILVVVGCILLVMLGMTVITSGKEAKKRAVLTIHDVTLSVRLANSPFEQIRGLSGVALHELQADGMLFVFDKAEVRNFWMKDMQFNLDVVWICEGEIVSVTKDVPAPPLNGEPARMSSAPLLADMVLELPSGQADSLGLIPGALVKVQLP